MSLRYRNDKLSTGVTFAILVLALGEALPWVPQRGRNYDFQFAKSELL